MSILIKGMEMPTRCGECKAFVCYRQYAGDSGDCFCGITKSDAEVGARNADCPLVPVPPHGDLIDRDAILKAYGLSTSKVDCSGCKYKNEVRCEKYELCEALNDAPTIIEAEEGE